MFGCLRGYAAPTAVSPAYTAPVAGGASCCRPKCCWYILPSFILLGLLGLCIPGGFLWILLLILLFIIICVATF